MSEERGPPEPDAGPESGGVTTPSPGGASPALRPGREPDRPADAAACGDACPKRPPSPGTCGHERAPERGPVSEVPFWERKSLVEMTPEEWESLCDGCGRCCLVKLEDPDDGGVVTTAVACRLLDVRTARCSDYPRRRRHVPECVVLRPEALERLMELRRRPGATGLTQGMQTHKWLRLTKAFGF